MSKNIYEANITSFIFKFLNSLALCHQRQEGQMQIPSPCWYFFFILFKNMKNENQILHVVIGFQ